MAVPSALPSNSGHVSTLALRASTLVDLAVDASGNLYTAEYDAIRKITPDGSITLLASVANQATDESLDLATTIANPAAIAVDRAGVVYVGTNQFIYKIPPGGKPQRVSTVSYLGYFGSGKAGFVLSGMAIDSKGNLYLASSHSDTIHRIAPDGSERIYAGRNISLQAGPGLDGSGYADGPADQALFRRPSGLAIDAQDNLYIADSNNSAIRKISSDGIVSTLVGRGERPLPASPSPGAPSPDMSEWMRGTIAATKLAVDRSGTLYVACRDNRIRRVSPDGQVSEWAGDGTICVYPVCSEECPSPSPQHCYQDGAVATARFDQPAAIGISAAGTVYVLDGGPNFGDRHIRKIE